MRAWRLAHLRHGDAVYRDDGRRSEEPEHREATPEVAEGRPTFPEQVHQRENHREEEDETQQEQRVCQ